MADIRIYFGNQDKTLIRRQREDGPQARPPGQIGLGASGKNADFDPLTYSRGALWLLWSLPTQVQALSVKLTLRAMDKSFKLCSF